MSKYDYLMGYIYNKNKHPRNYFAPISLVTIEVEEKKIGFHFPESLKEFWLEIGEGVLNVSAHGGSTYDMANIFLSPTEVASIILKEEDAPMLLHYIEEYVHEGDIPFFEIGDSSSFLFMKKNSEKVYDMIGEVVTETLEEFIYKLYYESPAFYLFIGKEDQDPYRIRK